MKKNLIRLAIGTALILSIPLVAMQFSEEWDWRLPDFIIIGTLLFGSGLVYLLLADKLKGPNQRRMLAVATVLFVLYAWAELAVGVFTNIGS